MSHTVKIATQFTNIDILRKAFESLGWELKEKATVRSYENREGRTFDFVAVNPQKTYQAYDIGINTGETLEVFSDFYGGSVASQLGDNLGKLKQQYALHTIEDEYFVTGATITKTEAVNGSWIVEVEEI